jgi:hypothetical protein
MAEVCSNKFDNISIEIDCEDPGDIESQESIDAADGPGFTGVFYDDERVEKLEKKLSTLTQQLQEL